ncbi:hypothetical protein CHARACLAT_025873 [Characodon lateralis]|uniref:Uncharacterized protein n=1 Tax=Characodon lateralis TaxID=208331 RepID=A0ABU7DAL2_9TELE|nr:hypothetical protein [Characodon lateralis]
MVDVESHYYPPSPLENSVLDDPLCGDDDFMGSMEVLQNIPTSIDEDALSSLDVPEYQSSHNGSEGSSILATNSHFPLSEAELAWSPCPCSDETCGFARGWNTTDCQILLIPGLASLT